MKNQVIEVLNLEHGKRVIEYWKSKGVKDASVFLGIYTKEAGESFRYYGIIKNRFSNYSIEYVNTNNAETITLPEEKTFPRKMLVWDDDEKGKKFSVSFWRYAKELPEVNTKKQELLSKADELIQKANELKQQAEEL